MTKLHFVTFYTDGSIHGTADMREQEDEVRSLVMPHVDSYVAYNSEIVKAEGGEHTVTDLGEDFATYQKTGFEKIGFGAFKPWIMLHRFRDIAYGDIVIYRGVDWRKHPSYAIAVDRLRETCEWVLDAAGCDVYALMESPHVPLTAHMKTSVLAEFTSRVPDAYERPSLNTGTLIARKSAQSAHLLKGWLNAMTADRSLMAMPRSSIETHPSFSHQLADNALFSLFMYEQAYAGRIPIDYPRVQLPDRILSKDIAEIHTYPVDNIVAIARDVAHRGIETDLCHLMREECGDAPHPFTILYSLLFAELRHESKHVDVLFVAENEGEVTNDVRAWSRFFGSHAKMHHSTMHSKLSGDTKFDAIFGSRECDMYDMVKPGGYYIIEGVLPEDVHEYETQYGLLSTQYNGIARIGDHLAWLIKKSPEPSPPEPSPPEPSQPDPSPPEPSPPQQDSIVEVQQDAPREEEREYKPAAPVKNPRCRGNRRRRDRR